MAMDKETIVRELEQFKLRQQSIVQNQWQFDKDWQEWSASLMGYDLEALKKEKKNIRVTMQEAMLKVAELCG